MSRCALRLTPPQDFGNIKIQTPDSIRLLYAGGQLTGDADRVLGDGPRTYGLIAFRFQIVEMISMVQFFPVNLKRPAAVRALNRHRG